MTPIGTTVPVIGNGKGLGITNGTIKGSWEHQSSIGLGAPYVSNTFGNIGTIDTSAQTLGQNAQIIGVVRDPNNSGVIADLSKGMYSIIKY